jgi:hypothetical protein
MRGYAGGFAVPSVTHCDAATAPGVTQCASPLTQRLPRGAGRASRNRFVERPSEAVGSPAAGRTNADPAKLGYPEDRIGADKQDTPYGYSRVPGRASHRR